MKDIPTSGYQRTCLRIQKDDIHNTSLEEENLSALQDNQVLIKVDAFGLSSNNITYVALGDTFGYWGFFSNHGDKGVMPVWGFAEVIESNHPSITKGKRVFGYLPSATHWVLSPDKINAVGFMDASPERSSISPVYDHYSFCDSDQSYDESRENWQMTFQPLFMTSFVLAQHLVRRKADSKTAFDAIILTSASSKTAFGTAMLLQSMDKENIRIIGLTSPKNEKFVENLGCYDAVSEYSKIDEIASDLGESAKVIILDFAGNQKTITTLQSYFEKNQSSTLLIGATDIEGRKNKDLNKRAQGEIFFAPSEVQYLQKYWGKDEFYNKYRLAWEMFLERIASVMVIKQFEGMRAIESEYKKMALGIVKPNEMIILKPAGD